LRQGGDMLRQRGTLVKAVRPLGPESRSDLPMRQPEGPGPFDPESRSDPGPDSIRNPDRIRVPI